MPFGDALGTNVKSVVFPFSAAGNAQVVVGKPIYFQSDSNLDGENAIITSIELVNSTVCPTLPNFPTVTNITEDQARSGMLVISNARREEIAIVPLRSVIKGVSGAATTPQSQRKNNCMFWIDTQLWQNCYVVWNNIPAGVGVGTGMYFIVNYINKKDIVK